MQKIFFSSGNETIAGNLLASKSKNLPGVLLLYGGGRHVTKALFEDFQKALFTNGIASLAIDFPGDGESSGEFIDGSLKRRLEYASAAYQELLHYVDPTRMAVYGGSMGGYVAARLVEIFPQTKLLLLIAGAAYARDAEGAPLNEEFTKIITKPDSWKNSPSFDAMKNFSGNTLVLYGEKDLVIPEEIKKTYKNLAEGKGKSITITGGSHRLFTPTTIQEEKAKEKTVEVLIGYIKENL